MWDDVEDDWSFLKIKVKGKGVERVILEYKAKELWILDHELKKPLFS